MPRDGLPLAWSKRRAREKVRCARIWSLCISQPAAHGAGTFPAPPPRPPFPSRFGGPGPMRDGGSGWLGPGDESGSVFEWRARAAPRPFRLTAGRSAGFGRAGGACRRMGALPCARRPRLRSPLAHPRPQTPSSPWRTTTTLAPTRCAPQPAASRGWPVLRLRCAGGHQRGGGSEQPLRERGRGARLLRVPLLHRARLPPGTPAEAREGLAEHPNAPARSSSSPKSRTARPRRCKP